jgi:bla regulator protein blaR1
MNVNVADWLPLIQSLGWTLLHFLWQGALIGAGYAVVRLIVPPNRAETRYAAGLLALALMASAPVLTLSLIYPQSLDAAAAASVMPAEVTDAALTTDIAATPATELALDRALPWLVLTWLVGVAVMARRALREWQALERIARRCARSSPELECMLASLAKRFGVLRNVSVLVSEHIDTPTLIGWIKPVILVPTAVALGFPRQHVELILAHEIGHLRRYDHFVNLAQAVIETLLFYHPAVHWISREVRNDREVCCDRLVLRVTRGEPREYAQTLASLEELRLSTPSVAIAATGGVLLDRVRRIVDLPVPHLAATRPSTALTALAAIAVLMIGIQLARPDHKELDALAGALMERLPSPDAAMLVGLALRIEPPKWQAAAPVPPKLALVASEKPQAARPPVEMPVANRVAAVESLPRPALAADIDIALKNQQRLAPVADLAARAPKNVAGAAESVAPAKPAVMLPTSTVTARAKRLVAVRTSAPHYPDVHSSQPVRVDVEFGVAADGSVRDVRVTSDHANRAFGLAAQKAMGQWRFDPASVPADAQVRFQQSFVFAKQSDVRHRTKVSEGEEFDCVRRTGSLICRHPDEEEVALPLTIIEANADTGTRMSAPMVNGRIRGN